MNSSDTILIEGKRIVLRDQLPSDLDAFTRMQYSGEWRFWDAPWEGVRTSFTAEEEARYHSQFQVNLLKEKPVPRKFAVIATLDGVPIGSVNRYTQNAWIIGIAIFVDDYLNKGLGTEALQLWVDYLFTHSDVHRLGTDTWSFNSRMIRIAEKLGFVYEGSQREVQFWQNQWLDLVHFGLLRGEWEKRQPAK